jgi:hypothetical protein
MRAIVSGSSLMEILAAITHRLAAPLATPQVASTLKISDLDDYMLRDLGFAPAASQNGSGSPFGLAVQSRAALNAPVFLGR